MKRLAAVAVKAPVAVEEGNWSAVEAGAEAEGNWLAVAEGNWLVAAAVVGEAKGSAAEAEMKEHGRDTWRRKVL